MKKNAVAMATATINSVSWPSNICRIDGDFRFCSSSALSTGGIEFAGDGAFDDGPVTLGLPVGGAGILADVESAFFVGPFDSVAGVFEEPEPGSEVCATASLTKVQNFVGTGSLRPSAASDVYKRQISMRTRISARCLKRNSPSREPTAG